MSSPIRRSPLPTLLVVLQVLLFALGGAGCSGGTSSSDGTGPEFFVRTAVGALTSIAVTPTPSSLYAGVTLQLTATGTYKGAPSQDLTNAAIWSTSNAAIATVTAAGLVTTVGPGTATITATDGTIKGKATVKVLTTLTSIAVTPGATTLPANTTQALVATGSYDNKTTKNLTSTVTWASSNTAVATVTSAGFVVTVAPGTATISASTTASNSGTVVGTATITVDTATVKSVSVTPATKKLANGASQQFTATALFSDGTKHLLATPVVTWTSSSTAVASVGSTTGLVTGKALGTSTITAKHLASGVSGTAKVTVTAATLVSVAVTPSTTTLLAGATQQYAATGTYTDGTTNNLPSATWTSTNTAAATVSTAGLATAVAAGSTTIKATASGKSGSATLTVTAAALQSIALSPAPANFPAGTSAQLTATGTLSNGTTENVTSTVTWSSSSPNVATVSNATGSQGFVTTLTAGTTTISVVDPMTGVTQQETLTVTGAVLKSIAVTPVSPSLPVGTTAQLFATATYSDGSTADVTQTATWAVANADAMVSNASGSSGQVTGVTAGTVVVSATDPSTGITGQTTVTVAAVVLQSIVIAPSAASLAVGATVPLLATGTYSNGTMQNLTTSVTWSASGDSVSVSNAAGSNGLATGLTGGTSTVSAMDPTTGITGTAQITVTGPSLVAIAWRRGRRRSRWG